MKSKGITRRPRPSGAELRRDKSARRPRTGRASAKADRAASPQPANDQVGEPEMAAPEFEAIEAMADVPMTLEGTPDVPLGEDLELDVAPASTADDLADADDDEDEEPVAARGETSEREASDEEESEAAPAERREEEPQSFLAMYFRDMAELEVLRPEQEFETARNIEDLELDLWRTLLGFAPGSVWLSEIVEKTIGKPYPEFKNYRALAERTRRKTGGAAARSRFDKLVTQVAAHLKELDIDRLFVDAAIAEVRRVNRAQRNGFPVDNAAVTFSTATKQFRDFVHAVVQRSLRVKQAKNEFVKANLRLVVSIARRFNHGRLPLPDLIQEGNIGLMKAVERYDYRRGFRFSTYASWWIRHAISRALADKGRAVRLPVHMIDAYHRIAKSERELQSKLERPATTEEIASATGIEADKLEKMKTFLSETPVSLDRPISDEDGRRLIDVLVDPNEAPSPPDQMMTSETQGEMLKLLGGLKPIEADILRKRFGLVNDRERTLKEIGDEYHLSRERVRQLQEQALGKMRKAMAKREIL
ncbi:MAG TPA: sigma-70 family RNA polymerase sigma factor [Polyangia bacterium]|nr:sigma-70 family RNA polymerase sigma factor [Polyangia bacterium]